MYVCIYIYMYMQATYLTAGAATAYGVGVLSPDPASHAMFASSQKSAYSRSPLTLEKRYKVHHLLPGLHRGLLHCLGRCARAPLAAYVCYQCYFGHDHCRRHDHLRRRHPPCHDPPGAGSRCSGLVLCQHRFVCVCVCECVCQCVSVSVCVSVCLCVCVSE